MLRIVLRVLELTLMGLIGYNLTTALAGWRNQVPAPVGSRTRRFRVVVPAHNEEGVLSGLLGDLASQDYPEHLTRTMVLADRCTDNTAEIARSAGVEVAERGLGHDGKGVALSWYLDGHPLDSDESLLVLDADNRIPPNLLTRFADEFDAGHTVVQAYLGVSNPDVSPTATASALSYWASNRMVQLARDNLGWTADLGGTGMAFGPGVLQEAGGFGASLTEDQDLGVRLFCAGHRVHWVHDVAVLDEKPETTDVAMRQRSRWAVGRREVARTHAMSLLRSSRAPAIDLAIRLVQPSRMGVAVLSSLLAVAGGLGVPVMSVSTWSLAAAAQLLAPIPFLAREGVERRFLLRYPVLVLLPLLKIPARMLRQRGWYHTPHRGAG